MLKRLSLSSFTAHFSEVLSNFQSMTPLRILLILEKPNLVTIKFAWPPPPPKALWYSYDQPPSPSLQLTVNFLQSVLPSFKLRWRWLIPPPVPEKPCDLPKLFHSLPPEINIDWSLGLMIKSGEVWIIHTWIVHDLEHRVQLWEHKVWQISWKEIAPCWKTSEKPCSL